jgi:peptide/nickel transport system substrate-binding protein
MLTGAVGLGLATFGRAALAQGVPIVRGGVPLVALPSLPDRLDPAGSGWEGAWLRTLIYDAPLRPLTSGDIVAAVGIGLGLRGDGASVDLAARPGVIFADGSPLTVADLVASVERSIQHADIASAWRWERIERVETGDDRVRLVLREPDATLAASLASPLVPVTPGGAAVDAVALDALPPGTGPFAAHRRDGDRAVFRPNRGYWVIGQPRFDGCAVIGVDDPIERTSRLVTGLVDIVPDLPALDIPLLRDDPAAALVGGISRRLCAVVLNLGRGPLGDVRVRRLVAGVIDRGALVDGATAGTGVPAAALFPADHWAGAESPPPAPARPAGETRDALAALDLLPGWSLRLICPAAAPTLANTAILLQQQLAAAGIALAIDLLDTGAFAAARADGAFDLMATSLPPWLDPHEIAWPWLHSEGPENAGGFASPRVDRLLDRARGQPDEAVRGSLYGSIERIVSDQVPLVPLFATPWVDAARARVAGYTAHVPPSARGVASAWFAAP